MSKKKVFHCTVTMSYDANDPIDAAKQFIDNIQSNPGWYVDVKEIDDSGNWIVGNYIVDTANGEIEIK